MTIDEDAVAVVESDRPSPRGAHDGVDANINGLARRRPEVLEDHPALLFGGTGKTTTGLLTESGLRAASPLPQPIPLAMAAPSIPVGSGPAPVVLAPGVPFA